MRTKYSFYNFLVSIISGVLIPILGFAKVRLFIDLYGSDLNGLYLVFMQIITYINICEISFSLAFRQLLFKPLADKNYEEVNRIYSGVKSIYSIVGYAVIILSFLAALFIPAFTESTLPFGELMVLFLLLCLPFGISYFLLPPSLLIIADQKEYKISIWIQTIAIARMLLMIVVILLKLPYLLIFIIEGLNVLLSNIVSNRIAHRTYPWLKQDKAIKKNEEFMRNAKHTLIQRLSNIAINNTDSIIISKGINLTAVSIYGAYSYLIEAALKIINSAITSPINSFGNLFNSDAEDAYEVFQEFYELSMFFATVLSVCIFTVLDEFVYIWMHQPSYILPIGAAVIFSLNVFYLTQREAIIIIRDANRLFIEAKNNAYLMTVVKIVLSIALVTRYGIIGVLLGTFIAYGTVDFLYNPKLVYQKVFHRSVTEYYKAFFIRLLLAMGMAALFYAGYQYKISYASASLFHFVISLAVVGVCVTILTASLYAVLFPSFRRLVKRGLRLVQRKK